jgi:hypothetical protein
MASQSRFLVLIAILIVPSRLLGQVDETIAQQSGASPAYTATAQPPVTDVGADGSCCSPSCAAVFCCPTDCADRPAPRHSLFIFGGHFTNGSMGDTTSIFTVDYDDAHIIGLGYQRYHWSYWNFHLGWEVGVSARFGYSNSAEIWGGPTLRHEGIQIGNLVRIAPSLTAGFSAVTDSHGRELVREYNHRGNATFLYYLGPEIILSLPSHPNIELFYRLHHRCGGARTLGNLSEGYNANCIGMRIRF